MPMNVGTSSDRTGCLFMETTYTIDFMRLAEPPSRKSSYYQPFMSPYYYCNPSVPLISVSGNVSVADFYQVV